MMQKLAGQVAVVTGAARGIGRAYALRLASLGADVAVIDANLESFSEFELERRAMTADSTVAEISGLGRRSLGFEADVTDSSALGAAIDEIVGTWGRIDIAVCNAGGGAGSVAETKASTLAGDLLQTVVERNVYGTVYTCKAVSRVMKKARYGRIVTISSQAGRRADRSGGYAHYGAAKAGVQMYTRYLAQELGEYGITANCIAPGYVTTGRLAPMHEAAGGKDLESKIPLRRFGTPADCAGVLEFLTTDLGAYVTGALIPVDGGMTD